MINIIKIKTHSYSLLIVEPFENELVMGKTIDYIIQNLKLYLHDIETKTLPPTRIDNLHIEENEAFTRFIELLDQPGMCHDFHHIEITKTR